MQDRGCPFSNRVITQFRNASLLYVVTNMDHMSARSELTSQTYRPLELHTVVALFYFAPISPVTLLMKQLEIKASIR
jgi:ABC-type amino acid transport system permease subunit